MAVHDPSVLMRISGVTLGYPGIVALSGVSFEIRRGEFIGIIGPNGSGKSTLLKGILGLLPKTAGEIRLAQSGQTDLAAIRRKIGYVPQKSKNESHFPATVREVVMMGLYAQLGWLRRPQKEHWQRVLQSLELVGMADCADRPIADLSGGQQQRVMIARALVAEPELLLLDEPTAAVDITAQHSILELLEALNRENGITVLMVSHDVNEIVHFCHKLLLLDGVVRSFGEPAAVLTKENLRPVYGDRIFVYDHDGHPHILVGDFNG